MAREIIPLEPAERNPAQLRRTGLMITAVMVVGGILVMAAYLVKVRGDEDDGRPHVVGRLKQNFGARDQHSKAFATSQLKDKITLITPIAGGEKMRVAESLRVMKMVAERFPEDDLLRFVGVTVDPENDGPEQLAGMLEELGVADDPRWHFVQAEEENARSYLKKELRMDLEEKIRVEGEWQKRFRSIIVLIDQNLHVLEPQYDFNVAREVQDDAKRLLAEDPEEAARLDAQNYTEELRKAEENLLRSLEFIRAGGLEEGKTS